MKLARDTKRQLELDDLARKQKETIELNTLPRSPRRAVRVPDNSLWDPKSAPVPDMSVDHAANRYNDFTEAEWAPRLEHTRQLVEVLLPKLRGLLDAHRAEPYTPAAIPAGPRTAVRDAILEALQVFEDKYAGIVAEIRDHGQRSQGIKYAELATLAKPHPALNLDGAVGSWRQPMNRLRGLPVLPTAAAVDLSISELRALPERIQQWDDALRQYRSAPVNVFRALGQLRRDINSTLEGIQRNTDVGALTTWTLAVPLDPMAFGTPRIPVMPIIRDGQVEFD
jgi:hypothetical protein